MLIVVTNRHLCRGSFPEQVEKIARGRPDAVILREKDMSEAEYRRLALECARICRSYGVRLIVHSFVQIARDIGVGQVHLSFGDFMSYRNEGLEIGVSVHGVEEAVAAEHRGAAYLVAGHVFATESKKDAAPRGLKFLADICAAVRVPVYAIGGIARWNVRSAMAGGAAGVCVMSSVMTAERPEEVLASLRGACSLTPPDGSNCSIQSGDC